MFLVYETSKYKYDDHATQFSQSAFAVYFNAKDTIYLHNFAGKNCLFLASYHLKHEWTVNKPESEDQSPVSEFFWTKRLSLNHYCVIVFNKHKLIVNIIQGSSILTASQVHFISSPLN